MFVFKVAEIMNAGLEMANMTEALREVLCHGFEAMQLNRIDALVYPKNERSIRLLRELGFKQEGLLREYFYLAGKFHNHLLFSLLKRDWSKS